jgi:acyl carrier protein
VDPLEQEIAQLIIECTGLEDMRPDEIDPVAPLFVEGLGLDSIDALEIGWRSPSAMASSSPPTTKTNRRHFANVRALAAFVASQRGAAQAA